MFDLGGVLVDWNPRHLYRKLFGTDEAAMERFLADVCTPPWNKRQDAGRPFAVAIAELQQAHPEQAELIAAYFERWQEMLGPVNGETVALITQLRDRGLRVFALSDWSAETYPTARQRIPELDLFDDIVISGEVGHTKPDPRVFEIACTRFGIAPTEAFFVDDTRGNVEGARNLGFTAFHFSGAAALRDELSALGLL